MKTFLALTGVLLLSEALLNSSGLVSGLQVRAFVLITQSFLDSHFLLLSFEVICATP